MRGAPFDLTAGHVLGLALGQGGGGRQRHHRQHGQQQNDALDQRNLLLWDGTRQPHHVCQLQHPSGSWVLGASPKWAIFVSDGELQRVQEALILLVAVLTASILLRVPGQGQVVIGAGGPRGRL